MVTTRGEPTRSRAVVLVSALLRPGPVLFTLVTVAVIASFMGHQWAVALLSALIILVAITTTAMLAGAQPLPRLADQSHLLARLSWLGRYATAAFLLCISTFLGGLAGTVIANGSAQAATESLSQLVGIVGLYAARIAIVIFLAWLTIDTWRLGEDGRKAGFYRSLAWFVGTWLARRAEHPALTRWVFALTSPFLVGLTAIVGVMLMFIQTSGGVVP